MEPSDAGRRWRSSQSDQDWREVTQLAWRPAWRIRNRQGSLTLLLAWLRKTWFDGPMKQRGQQH